MIRGRPV